METNRKPTKKPLKKPIAQERVVCYIQRDKYNQLASKLKLKGENVSRWFREKVDQELKKKK